MVPPSKATPPRALSNLWITTSWRTPSASSSSSWASMSASVHCGCPSVDAAAERLRDLDAEDDGELAFVGHPPRLERIVDDAEPPLARSAALGVDVALELADALRLQANAVHLVAVVELQRVDLAQHPVLDEQVRQDAQPAPPRPLHPAVVGLLVGEGAVAGPVDERRPTGRCRGSRPACPPTGSSPSPHPPRR